MHVPPGRRPAFDEAIDSLADGGPLYHAWQEPASAPHHGMPDAAAGALALHGPGDREPVPLARVGGHLEWIQSWPGAASPPS
jgi:hypothetical protein